MKKTVAGFGKMRKLKTKHDSIKIRRHTMKRIYKARWINDSSGFFVGALKRRLFNFITGRKGHEIL